jgi:ribose/xylose/arabinose/galactoside ABC-type transport system permease subunit
LYPKTHLVIITVQINVSASVTAAWVFMARVSFHAEYTTNFPSWAAAAVLALTGVGVGPAAALAVRNRKTIEMTNATRLTLMTFPQHWDGGPL